MRRWLTVVATMAGLLLPALGTAAAQTALIGGGLTALPAVQLGPDRLQNGGFERPNGGLPAAWSGPGGWALDQIVKRSGAYSFRRGSGAGTATQSVPVKKGIYTLSGWVKTEGVGGANAGIRLQLDLRPAIADWRTTPLITGTRDWTYYEIKNVIVPQDMTVVVKLENYGGATGTAWFDDVKLVEQLPQAVDVFMLYPNFRGMLFDDQPLTLRFDLTVTPPDGDFGRYRLSGTLRDEATGQVVASAAYPAQAHLVGELDGHLMQYGRPYLAAFALVDLATGTTVATYPAYRVSRVPAAARQAMNVAFDAKNRILLKGRPRFILGVYDSGNGYSTSDAYWESTLWSPAGPRRLDGLRINFYLNYWLGQAPADAIKALMTNLQKRGVAYLQTGNCFARGPAGPTFAINGSDAYVRDIGAHPGSGGYYTADECDSALIPGVFAQYQRLRTLDPDGITFATLFGHEDIRLWRDAADVLASDPYPLYAAEPPGGYDHGQVAAWTARTREAVKDARPIMTVLQFFKFTSKGRWPTRQEMRNHAYMAIVEGARGLWWWSVGNGLGALATVCSDWCAERTAYMNNLRAVVNEIADLEPALLADDAPGALRGNSSSAAVKTRVKLYGGKGYVFAYNATNQSVTATLTWNTAPGTVTVNGEGRTLPASGASFSDTFGPYQAHVYVIGAGGGAGGGGTLPPPGTPTVSFTNPRAGATLSGTATVTLAAAGGTPPYTYRLAVDGVAVYTGANGTFSVNTANLANGPHTLAATVTDAASRTGTASLAVTVANGPAPPPGAGGLQVSITSPRPGATVSGGAVAVNVWLEGYAGASNVYTVAVDGRTVGTRTSAGAHVTFVWDSRTVADGSHTLTATGRDAAGKTGTASVTFTTRNGVAAAPPPPPAPAPPPGAGGLQVFLTSPAAGATVSRDVAVNVWVEGQAAGATIYTLAVDGRLVGSKSSTGAHVTFVWPSQGNTNGTHTLTATVRDAAGRTGTLSRTVVVRN